jgi:hypothetical protein
VARRNLLLSANGFDSQILAMEDWDLWLRLMAAGGRFFAIQPCLARYRLHSSTNSQQPDRMRAGRLQALEKLFAKRDLPFDIQSLKPRIFGSALMQSSVELYTVERDSEALRNFCDAVRSCPELMEENEVFYAVACAQQPVGYKSTGKFLDLAVGERRLLEAIRAGLQVVGPSDKKLSGRVYSRAYLTLGRLAYSQRRMDNTRRYIYHALKFDPGSIFRTDVLSLLGRSLVRPKWLDIFKGLKEHKLVKSD